MSSEQGLYTSRIDPEFAELADQFEKQGPDDRVIVTPTRRRRPRDENEDRKAAQLFG